MKNPWLIPVATLIVGAAAGFISGKNTGAAGDAESEAEAGMRAWLAENPQGKFGKHEYKLAEYGLSKEKLDPLFERYLSEYEVEREG